MTTDHSDIRALLDRWANSVRERDLDGIAAIYTEDIVAFDAIGALRFSGLPSYREHWRRCLEQTKGEVLFQLQDLHIEQDGSLACAFGLCHCGCENEQGEMEGAWMRFTQLMRRSSEQWRIIHEHWSAPFDPQSGQTHFALQPE
ncbi:MAG TPA: nuclear transport factor 2 family protein [Pseudomonas sp.]|jgi:uncharacterized protein (TIGR02246 family)|nr:nuclear transport factor 2 family protein [Pseudomonas sp.]